MISLRQIKNRRFFKKLAVCSITLISGIWMSGMTALAEETTDASVQLEIPAKSCILTDSAGNVLYEDNADQLMPPASIT